MIHRDHSRESQAPRAWDSGPLFGRGNEQAQGAAPSRAASKDDSGLIDIRALMAAAKAAAPPAQPTAEPVAQNLAVYPLGTPEEAAPAPATAPQVPAIEARASRKNWVFLAIGGGALVAAVAAVLVMRSPSPGPQSGVVDAAGPNGAAVTARASDTAANDSGARKDETGTQGNGATPPAKADTAPPDGPGSVNPGGAESPAPNKAVGPKTVLGKKTPVPPPPKPTVTPKPAADPCHGDLMCAMKRSTEKH